MSLAHAWLGRCPQTPRASGQQEGRLRAAQGAKATGTSFEPESNQRPKDVRTDPVYSPPLYQLSYRRVRFFFFFFVFLLFLWAAPAAYGGSQARG